MFRSLFDDEGVSDFKVSMLLLEGVLVVEENGTLFFGTANPRTGIWTGYPTEEGLGPPLIAREFGITSKAVRDVWTQKSWVSVTTPFWTIVHGPSLASLQAHCQESGRERARGHGGVPLDVRGL